MSEQRILLAHGNGGRYMRELIADIFARHLANPVLNIDADAVSQNATRAKSWQPGPGHFGASPQGRGR